MKQTVAAYIAKTLEQAGVKRIWGVTGDSLNGLSDSLNRMGTIDWMPTRHEEVAAFAAGAEAQLTGELAVCAGSCGPGNLHLINGLFFNFFSAFWAIHTSSSGKKNKSALSP